MPAWLPLMAVGAPGIQFLAQRLAVNLLAFKLAPVPILRLSMEEINALLMALQILNPVQPQRLAFALPP